MGWMVQGLNPGGGEVFYTVHTGPGAHPASYTIGTWSFPGVKQPGRGIGHPPPSSTEVKERVELYVSGFSGLVVSMLASGTRECRFAPGRSRWIFLVKKSLACFPSEGK
jgi:hypothetical protein